MTPLSLALTASALPTTPLVMGHFGIITAVANAVLVLCVVALWFERERPESQPHPVPFDREHRLAA